MMLSMERLNENIIHQYNKWKKGYTRKENSFKQRVQDFLSNRKNADRFKISEDGKHLDTYSDVYIYDDDILDGKFIVPFGEVGGCFDCSCCTSLTSLEGAPKTVAMGFDCCECESLTSLEGAPECVGSFNCAKCESLTSLKGAPEEVVGSFNCRDCISLTSLEGAPEEVSFYFKCIGCTSLTSLKGLPKLIRGDLHIDKRFEGKIPDDVIIKERIKYV